MTETELDPARTTATNTWNAAFAALKARFPKAKDSIAFCIHALQANPDIALDDLKAQALMHGIRITGASVTAAQRLMSGTPKATAPAARPATAAPTPPARRVRAPEAALDPTAMIHQVVAKLQRESGAEAERLRLAIKKAIAVLQAAVES
jgi:hypothetical protein